MSEQVVIAPPSQNTLNGLRSEFAVRAHEYRLSEDEDKRRGMVREIDAILDRHTQLEAALGVTAIEEVIG